MQKEHWKHGCRKGRGFTLIELLVVVAIIALIIAILLPSLAAARERAKFTVCQTHLRAWATGFHLYSSDWDDALPLDGGDGTSGTPIGVWSDSRLWFNGVTAYMGTGNQTYDQLQLNAVNRGNRYDLPKGGSNSFFVCPSATEAASATVQTGDVVSNGLFQTWGYYSISPSAGPFTEQRPMLLCYGMNSQLRTWDYSNWQNYYGGTPGEGDISKMSRLTPPSKVVLIAEKRVRQDELAPNDPNYSKGLAQSKVTATRFAARHYKGGNVAMADGHVEWFSNLQVNKGAVKTNYYNLPNLLIWNPSTE